MTDEEWNLSEKITAGVTLKDYIELKDVKRFIRREKDRRRKQINILLEESSPDRFYKAEMLVKELDEFLKDAGEKLI